MNERDWAMKFNRNHYLIAFVLVILMMRYGTVSTKHHSADSGLQTDRFAELKLQLDTLNRGQARSAIRELGQNGNKQAIDFLRVLWNHGAELKAFKHPDVIKDPVVRLMLAQQLLHNGEVGSGSYSSYIKSQSKSRNWIIRANSAEALVAVGDKESIELLSAIAMTPHRLVALRAVRSLEQLSRSRAESVSKQALSTLNSLLDNAELKDQEVKKEIWEVRQKLLQFKHESLDDIQLKRVDGFIPFNEAETRIPYKDAFPDLKRRAESGDPEARHILGERHLVGIHTESNYTKALKWLTLAVQQDYAPAKASLAQMYLTGRGVKQDRVKAIQLLVEAAQQGYEPAQRLLGVLNRKKDLE